MGRVIVSMNITVDGYMAGPDGELDWQFNNWTTEMGQLLGEQLSQAGTILLGRNTYNALANYWPFAGTDLSLSRDDIAYATLMNSYPKMVCSSTLKAAAWQNSTIIKANVFEEIKKLKQQAGKDIIIYGSGTLVQYLAQKRLIDEYRLWIYPVALGRGKPLFKQKIALKLSSSRQFPSGVLVLTYHPQDY
jgi:dihydrofolate reductase